MSSSTSLTTLLILSTSQPSVVRAASALIRSIFSSSVPINWNMSWA